MAFTAADVKNLREMTGVGMMDCKKALTASDGDMDKAVEFLREKGLAAAAKKAGRIAAEGMAYAAVMRRRGRGRRGQLPRPTSLLRTLTSSSSLPTLLTLLSRTLRLTLRLSRLARWAKAPFRTLCRRRF